MPRHSSLPTDESAWQGTIVDLASKTGWRHYHTYNSRRSVKGFPDLVLVRESVIYVEVKTDIGRVSPEQEEWIAALRAAGQEVHVWRPRDFAQVQARLTKRRAMVSAP